MKKRRRGWQRKRLKEKAGEVEEQNVETKEVKGEIARQGPGKKKSFEMRDTIVSPKPTAISALCPFYIGNCALQERQRETDREVILLHACVCVETRFL